MGSPGSLAVAHNYWGCSGLLKRLQAGTLRIKMPLESKGFKVIPYHIICIYIHTHLYVICMYICIYTHVVGFTAGQVYGPHLLAHLTLKERCCGGFAA